MSEFLAGAVTLGSAAAGLFFFKFWRHTRDRFFLYFAASFWIEALNRIAIEAMPESGESNPVIYGVRLVAYGLIIWAIWEKNRPSKPRSPDSCDG